jgi:hypothetical protein
MARSESKQVQADEFVICVKSVSALFQFVLSFALSGVIYLQYGLGKQNEFLFALKVVNQHLASLMSII